MNPQDFDAASPNFFLLLLLGGAILYGLFPDLGAMMLMLAWLWAIVSFPVITIVLTVLWCLRWLAWDFLLAFVAGRASSIRGFQTVSAA